ncbi:ankyrin repeat domain-containing protein [Pseudoduganella sp. RAF19]|uniref:ankyrin repeat domain-containing protein n=2 Tax=unclassified Pseudoduganella TaxID=2637179 RepID=UPI003F9D500C
MAGKLPKRKTRVEVDRLGRTQLHYAAADANLALLSTLVAQGELVNAQDDYGWMPLHFAVQANSVGCTIGLLEAGANVSVVDSDGTGLGGG